MTNSNEAIREYVAQAGAAIKAAFKQMPDAFQSLPRSELDAGDAIERLSCVGWVNDAVSEWERNVENAALASSAPERIEGVRGAPEVRASDRQFVGEEYTGYAVRVKCDNTGITYYGIVGKDGWADMELDERTVPEGYEVTG